MKMRFSAADPEHKAALQRLQQLVDDMGTIGANDMGWLSRSQASRYHKITEQLQKLVEGLE